MQAPPLGPMPILRMGPHPPLCLSCTKQRGGNACAARSIQSTAERVCSAVLRAPIKINSVSRACAATSPFRTAAAQRSMGASSQDMCGCTAKHYGVVISINLVNQKLLTIK